MNTLASVPFSPHRAFNNACITIPAIHSSIPTQRLDAAA